VAPPVKYSENLNQVLKIYMESSSDIINKMETELDNVNFKLCVTEKELDNTKKELKDKNKELEEVKQKLLKIQKLLS
jgi:septal ring factor EnvC (AmiA/AmiB activator)